MQLFFTDSTFIWHGLARPGIPFLCAADMELIAAPNSYLRFISAVKGRTRSPKTWRTYASHLYEFFVFLETNELMWDRLNESLLAAWRDSMTMRACSRSTVNQRLRCVAGFYTWAVRSKIVHESPFSLDEIRVSKHPGLLAHVDSSGGRFTAVRLTVQTARSEPKFLTMNDALRFLEALRPHVLKLMGYLALLTGMRRDEITGMRYQVMPNPCGHDSTRQLPMVLDSRVTPTKGMRTRTVMLPYDIAVALWDYFCLEWPKRHAAHKRKHGRESDHLFLSEYGDELSERYMNNAFAKASKRIKIQCHPHMLRHTFGTYEMLRMSKKYGQDKALLWLRERLGHSSITTTEIYVHTADLLKNSEVDDYQLEVLERLCNGN
jgi:integrase